MIKSVIFDMDGVIIDSEPIHKEIQTSLFERYKIQLSDHQYQTYIGRSSKNMWQELIQIHQLDTSVEEVLSLDKQWYHQKLRSLKDLKPIAGVNELILDLEQLDLSLVLASSSSMESIELVLGLFGLLDHFKHKISGAPLPKSKPHPQIFQEAASMIGHSPGNCVVIEDSHHGVAAAKAAGMYCIGYQNLNSGNQDLAQADLVVDDFRKLSTSIIMDIYRK